MSQQRYVEIIGDLLREHGEARMTDVARRMAVSLPSASEAVKRLEEVGIVKRSSNLGVFLSEAGRRIDDQLERRHEALKRFMVEVMAMPREQADDVACRVEHCVDKAFTDRLLDLARFLENEYPWTLQGIADHVRSQYEKKPWKMEVSEGI